MLLYCLYKPNFSPHFISRLYSSPISRSRNPKTTVRMGQKHQSTADSTTDPKKRRRVGFSNVDSGVEANECIKIYLVSCKEDVGASDSFCIDPVDLNHFFEPDGKIYGYQGLKINIWMSSVSFHAYPDITFQSVSDGGKGITDLKSSLQDILGENLIEDKEDFLQTFSKEANYIRSIVSSGEVLEQKTLNGHINGSNSHMEESSNVEVVRMPVSGNAGYLYGRLVPLVLLLIDGSSAIDVNDPCWDMYLLIQKITDLQGEAQDKLLGFAVVYRFHHYPGSTRLRLGQILVLPPYQHKGYGRHLLEVLNSVAVSENVYDLTIEEPMDNLQHVRTCIDTSRLLKFDPIQQAVDSVVSSMKQGKLSKKIHKPRFVPPPSAIKDVRKSLKINRKQLLNCWEVLIYLGLDPVDKYMDDFVSIISERLRVEILGKDSETAGKRVIEVPSDYNPEMSFVMFKSCGGEDGGVKMDENQPSQEEQLRQVVDDRVNDIKLIAQKVSVQKCSVVSQ